MDKSDHLSHYLKEIGRSRTLSKSEEIALGKRIRNNDKAARNELICANLKFVVSVCRNYENRGLPLADLINEGNLGLIRAATRFDETRQFKFISYAVWWIRQSILQALTDKARLVKLPANRISELYKLAKAKTILEQRMGRSSGPEVRWEFHQPVPDLLNSLQDETDTGPDAKLLAGDLHESILQVLENLPYKEAMVLKMYYGLEKDTSFTLSEIGIRLNLTRERVRQIKEKALRKLKHVSRRKPLHIYADC